MKSRKRATAFEPDMTEGFTYAHRCCNRAIRFLEQYSDQDFFLTFPWTSLMDHLCVQLHFNHMYDGFSFVMTMRASMMIYPTSL